MTEWRQFCRGVRDLRLDSDGVIVTLSRGRQHRLQILPVADAIELRGIVVRRSIVEGLEDANLAAWRRNRATSIVAFRLDDRGRIVGEAWLSCLGLTQDEFLFYVRGLAAACDLLEFQLTGRDQE